MHARARIATSLFLGLALAASACNANDGATATTLQAGNSGQTGTATGTQTETGTATPNPTPTATAPPRTHHLSTVAQGLGELSESAYDAIQLKWLGTAYPACNYFVDVSMCQDGLCAKGTPDALAATYGTYLEGRGWKEITLDELKTLFLTQADFDVVMQADGLSASSHGHVLVPVSIDLANDEITVAQGELGTITHQVRTEPINSLMTEDGGMHIWVSQ